MPRVYVGNGAFKRAFPFINRPISIDHGKEAGEDFVAAIHLFNLRTRVIGFNQIRTTFMSHVDSNFREQLECKTLEEYMDVAKARFNARASYGL